MSTDNTKDPGKLSEHLPPWMMHCLTHEFRPIMQAEGQELRGPRNVLKIGFLVMAIGATFLFLLFCFFGSMLLMSADFPAGLIMLLITLAVSALSIFLLIRWYRAYIAKINARLNRIIDG